MPDFAYVARDATGQKVSGTLAAATEREVIKNAKADHSLLLKR